VVLHLPSKFEALSSNPSSERKKNLTFQCFTYLSTYLLLQNAFSRWLLPSFLTGTHPGSLSHHTRVEEESKVFLLVIVGCAFDAKEQSLGKGILFIYPVS
jgi:hypothetical protein